MSIFGVFLIFSLRFGETPRETANPFYYITFLNNFDFIKHIKNRAYIPDDVLLCYADILGNLNTTNQKLNLTFFSFLLRLGFGCFKQR